MTKPADFSLDNLMAAISDAGQPSIAQRMDLEMHGKPEDILDDRYADELRKSERGSFVDNLNQVALESNVKPHEVAFYPDGPVLDAFYRDRSWWSSIMGPFGPVSPETEFFTGNVWKQIQDYKPGDQVLQWDPRTRWLSMAFPEDYVVQDADQWIEFTHSLFHQKVSPEHKMGYFKAGTFHETTAEELSRNLAGRKLPTGGSEILLDGCTVTRSIASPGEKKYCFTLPAGYFVVRSKGKISVTGNSGKTIATVAKLLKVIMEVPVSRGTETPKAPKGVRKSRLMVIRQSYAQLERTTLKDWQLIFPDYLGVLKKGNKIEQHVRITLPDGTQAHCEVEFVPLDMLKDLSRITGAQLTFVWANEAREILMELMDTAIGRTGRTPSKGDVGRYFSGLVADYNAPSEDSELCELREKKVPNASAFWRVVGTFPNGGEVVYWKAKPRPNDPDHPANFPDSPDSADYAMFRQPGGLVLNEGQTGFEPNQEAENLSNLPGGYYSRLAERSFSWVYVNGANLYGVVTHGRPVHPDYKPQIHRREVVFKPEWKHTKKLYGGFDAGRTPAFVLGAEVSGGIEVFYEMQGFGAADRFSVALAEDLWDKFEIKPKDIEMVFCDPRGGDDGQQSDGTPILMLQSAGFNAVPSPCENDTQIRRAALDGPLTSMRGDGLPMILISPEVILLNQALAGGFKFKLIQSPGGENKYSEKPDKNEYSHVAEACEYLMVGRGYGFRFLMHTVVADDGKKNASKALLKNVGTHFRDRR